MRKCLDCGAEVNNVDMKCPECQSENLSLIEEEKVFKEKKPKGGLILLIVVVIIGIIAALIVGDNAKNVVPAKPIEKAVTALYAGDLDGYINEMYGCFTADAENYFSEEFGNFETYKQENDEILKQAYGENYSIKSKIVDVYNYSDKMVELVQQTCDDLNYDIKIEELKHVCVRVSIENEEGAQSYYIADEYSVQVGGKWYFLPKDMLIIE